MSDKPKQTVTTHKYVELTYQVIDQNTDDLLTQVTSPLAYVHGASEILSPPVTAAIEGTSAGDIIEVPIDCNEVYGPRDESLVITEAIDNVPKEYRKVGTAILMENDQGRTKSFLVTDVDDKKITIDGNNPLCGRQVVFRVEIHTVRDATDEEIEYGGKVG